MVDLQAVGFPNVATLSPALTSAYRLTISV